MPTSLIFFLWPSSTPAWVTTKEPIFSSKIAHFLLKLKGLHMVWIDNVHLMANPLPLLAVLWDKCARGDKCNFSRGISTCHRKEEWTDVKGFCEPVQLLLSFPCQITGAAPRVVQGKRHLPHCQSSLLSPTSQTMRTKSSSTFSIFLIFRETKKISNESLFPVYQGLWMQDLFHVITCQPSLLAVNEALGQKTQKDRKQRDY